MTDPKTPAPTLLWMECGACSGESMAILGAEGRGRRGDTLPAFLDDHGVRLLWHPSLSLESPRQAAELISRIVAGEQHLTLLCTVHVATTRATANRFTFR